MAVQLFAQESGQELRLLPAVQSKSLSRRYGATLVVAISADGKPEKENRRNFSQTYKCHHFTILVMKLVANSQENMAVDSP